MLTVTEVFDFKSGYRHLPANERTGSYSILHPNKIDDILLTDITLLHTNYNPLHNM